MLETHGHELDCCSRQRESVDCVQEVLAIAEDVVTFVRLLAPKMPKAHSTEPVIHSHSCDMVEIASEVRDECEVAFPFQLVEAPVVLIHREV